MDGASDEVEARRQEELQRLSEVVGARGRAYYCGANGYEWEVEWFSEQKNPYSGLNLFTRHATLEEALDYARRYGGIPSTAEGK